MGKIKNYSYNSFTNGISIDSNKIEKPKNLINFLENNGYNLKDLYFHLIGSKGIKQYIFVYDPKKFNLEQKEINAEFGNEFENFDFIKLVGDN